MRYLFFLTALLLSPLIVSADTEEPSWELLVSLGEVEVRQYAPSIQAVTSMSSSRGTSSGFRRLAGYIFGGNERSQSIAMTAPVQETLREDSPELAFTLPAEFTLDELPAPTDESVTIRSVPSRTVAVIRFSGWATAGTVERKQRELLDILEQEGIRPSAVPVLNQYNPPWTPPFLRRNEIAVEIESINDVVPLQ